MQTSGEGHKGGGVGGKRDILSYCQFYSDK